MEFWGAEVKSGQSINVKISEGSYLHFTQASLGEIDEEKTKEYVSLEVTVGDKKYVLAILHPDKVPQELFNLVFDKDFQISHNSKNGSVYFYGYQLKIGLMLD